MTDIVPDSVLLSTGHGRLVLAARLLLTHEFAKYNKGTADNPAFNLRRWFQHLDDGGICGTVCCVVGWAASQPIFNSIGLRMSGSRPLYNDHGDPSDPGYDYAASSEWNAVQKCFGLTRMEAAYLFSNAWYDNGDALNPKAVAKRILDFVADPVKVMANR